MATNKQFEKFVARIKFLYAGDKGREIGYIYNREALNGFVEIPVHKPSAAQFIEIGDVLLLDGYKCKVVDINFKLDETFNEHMEKGFGINMLSPTPPTNFNCTINVFVERMKG